MIRHRKDVLAGSNNVFGECPGASDAETEMAVTEVPATRPAIPTVPAGDVCPRPTMALADFRRPSGIGTAEAHDFTHELVTDDHWQS